MSLPYAALQRKFRVFRVCQVRQNVIKVLTSDNEENAYGREADDHGGRQ
jgi:hypothetical protein